MLVSIQFHSKTHGPYNVNKVGNNVNVTGLIQDIFNEYFSTGNVNDAIS
jgi:hypothetical protein